MQKIIRNEIKCNHCGDVIESTYRRQFAKEMISTGVVDAIRSEKGNLQYDYFLPINNSETVLLIGSL